MSNTNSKLKSLVQNKKFRTYQVWCLTLFPVGMYVLLSRAVVCAVYLEQLHALDRQGQMHQFATRISQRVNVFGW